jgi:squalene-hopene/tetraprenyl-beta-curcumene cyclase
LLTAVRADASWALGSGFETSNTVLATQSFLPGQKATAMSHGGESHSDWHDIAISSDTAVAQNAGIEKDHAMSAGSIVHDSDELFRHGIEWLLKTQRMAPGVVTDSPAGGWAASAAAGAELSTIVTADVVSTLAQGFGRVGEVLDERIERSAGWGVGWLLEMQSDDGGWGTFSRNDDAQAGAASCVDATAASLRAIAVWHRRWKVESPRYTQAALHSIIDQIPPAIERAIKFLEFEQRDDGCFIPLWFGNQHQANDENPVIGTCQVLGAFEALGGLASNTAHCRLVACFATFLGRLGAAASTGRLFRK